ncbi:MAG: ATP-dependent DNA helicase RecQ [Spirosomataceae bacterium]
MTTIKTSLRKTLKEVFGFDSFRGKQEEIIHTLASGENTFVIMPTGAGKSLCYQLPAIVLDGTAIVISPLIALMKNQVDQMNAFGINAQFLNSTLNKSEMTRVKNDVLKGVCKLLYIAPESLTKEDNLIFLKKADISFVAVDEAHCISEWGHDFRPEYRRIRSIIESINPELPIIALTATATPKVQLDIQKNLNMDDSMVFKTSFNRKNLYYEVRAKKSAKKQLVKYVSDRKGKSGIVYCLSRKKVAEIAELLRINGFNAVPYHAGLEAEVRKRNQEGFLNENIDIVVATIAFGMGIDKPDVRFVVHYDAPKSVEGYYQESGRGGRDGLDGDCLMFYSYADILKLEKFSKDKTVTERDNAKALLMEIVAYANLGLCRRRQLLSYFGEHMATDCGFCDNCVHPNRRYQIEQEAVLALNTVMETEERFSLSHIADLLTANPENAYIKSHQHDTLKAYGKGLEYFKDEFDKEPIFDPKGTTAVIKTDINGEGKRTITHKWLSIMRQLMVLGFLEKDLENINVAILTERGREFLKKSYPIEVADDHDFTDTEGSGADALHTAPMPGTRSSAADETLLALLKALRKKVAKSKNVPPYVVFQDPSLEEMATTYPTTEQDLAQVSGVGMGKVRKFGKAFTEAITKYVEENDIETTQDMVVKTAVNKSKTKIFIIQQVDRKVNLDEIAQIKGIPMHELYDEVDNICYSGTKLNLDYYIDQVIDTDIQDDIYDYFMSAKNDTMRDAVLHFSDDEEINEEEIRLMRVKFLSEVAN